MCLVSHSVLVVLSVVLFADFQEGFLKRVDLIAQSGVGVLPDAPVGVVGEEKPHPGRSPSILGSLLASEARVVSHLHGVEDSRVVFVGRNHSGVGLQVGPVAPRVDNNLWVSYVVSEDSTGNESGTKGPPSEADSGLS